MRILLIEDEVSLAHATKKCLQDYHGMVVDLAGCTHDAIEYLEGRRALGKAPPACIVTDVALPGGDAISTLPELRRRFAGPIVVCTGFDVEAEDIRTAGFDHRLSKPIDCSRLAAFLRNL